MMANTRQQHMLQCISSQLCWATSYWQPEIGHGESICTMVIGKCYQPGFPREESCLLHIYLHTTNHDLGGRDYNLLVTNEAIVAQECEVICPSGGPGFDPSSCHFHCTDKSSGLLKTGKNKNPKNPKKPEAHSFSTLPNPQLLPCVW